MRQLIFLIFIFSLSSAQAINVQQFSRSNSLTYEMIEDARLSSSHVINHYTWLFNLGISYVDQPLTVKNSDNSQQLDSIIESMQSVHLGVAYYIKPWWQLAANTSFSHFESNSSGSINEFQDIDLKSKFRIYNGKRNAFTIMPIASIPLSGGEITIQDNANPPEVYGTDEVLSDSGVGLGAFLIYEHLFKHFQLSLNLGYKINSKARFIDDSGTTQIDKRELLTAGLGAYIPVHKRVGINVEYLQNFSKPIFDSDINPAELFIGASGGLRENIHGFIGAGFGNFFSDDDGNDYRLVAGIKFTPGMLGKKSIKHYESNNLKPNRIIEDSKFDQCKNAYLFDNTNSITILFDNNSSEISNSQKIALQKVIEKIKQRGSDIESIKLYGHASSSGDKLYNEKLGYRRANTIKSFLLNNNISESKLEVVKSLGENELLEPEQELENKPVNRRVEMHFKLTDKYRGCYE